MSADQVVCVTGASGYVGAHVVKQLLERGYTVHATVRDASNERKTKFIRDLVPDAAGRLKLFSADLTAPGSFDEAVAGAHYVIHTAASVMLTAKDPQKEIVDVTVDGVKNVLSACDKAKEKGTFKRFVLTSSMAAIQDLDRPEGHVYTEADSNESATVKDAPYDVSKLQSERAIEAHVAALPAEQRYTYAFINPGAIYGPVFAAHHLTSSPQIIGRMMEGKVPMIPDLNFPSVDVRDVAKAHILAMENPEAEGRFLVIERNYAFKEIAAICKKAYPQYKFPSTRLPNFLMYTAALFDKSVTFSFCRQNLSKVRTYSNEKARTVLGLEFTDVGAKTLTDTCESILDIGAIPRKE